MLVRWFLTASILASASVQGCYVSDGNTSNTPAITETTISDPPSTYQDCSPLEEYLDGFIHSVDVSSDGSFLVAIGGNVPGGSGKVVKTDPRLCVTTVLPDIVWPHSARERLVNGEVYTLVTETGAGNVLVFGPRSELLIIIHMLSDFSTLVYPNNAEWLTDTSVLVTDRFQNRIVELSLDGRILWQYGGEGKLAGPHSGKRLPSGNTLISDSDNDRVVEVNRSGDIVWSYSGTLNWPRGVQRLDNGNTLVVSSYEGVVVEVSPSGAVVWRSYIYNLPYEVSVGEDGSMLMSIIGDVVSVGSEALNAELSEMKGEQE